MDERVTAADLSSSHSPAGVGGQNERTLADHLVRLPRSSWALWRWVGLRGAGFPAAQVLRLAAPACAALADQLIRAEGNAQDARAHGDRELRHTSPNQTDRLWHDLQAAFTTATAHTSQVIQDIARTPRFREALTWQNRHELHELIDPLLHRSPANVPQDAEQQRGERLVGTYLQRYCVKNDLFGFFGPVGWANLVSNGPAIAARPGPHLTATCDIGFEAWGIDALAEVLTTESALLPWIAPRQMPFIYLDGTTLYLPGQAPALLPLEQAAILRACDGQRLAKNIASELVANAATGLRSEDEVYQILQQLRKNGLIAWALEVPIEPHAERVLRRQLGRIGDVRLREPALQALNDLEAAYAAVAHATGDADKLEQALNELDATFTRLTGRTGTPPTNALAARPMLVHMDCRRDIEVDVGPALLDAVGPALTLLLDSARWFTNETAVRYRHAFQALYAELAGKLGSPTLDAVTFWSQVQRITTGEGAQIVNSVLSAFQERWAKILTLTPGERQVRFASQELRVHVQEQFGAPMAGWSFARYQTPDLLIDAPDIESIRRGEYQCVLGERHIGSNPLLFAFVMGQHPTPEQLWDAFAADVPEVGLVPVPSKQWPGRTTRNPLVLATSKDLLLAVFPDACGLPSSQIMPIGHLVVEDTASGLVVRTRDGKHQFDIIEAFSGLLSSLVIASFKMFPIANHLSRVTIDRLVVQRETWCFAPTDIPFAGETEEVQRFVAARRWGSAYEMPRFVFVKTSLDPNPLYVDFDSPLYVELFAEVIRRTAQAGEASQQIIVTEMLPAHDSLWLPDAEDQRYTCQLRFVAVDLAPYTGGVGTER
jgi:hypothetical protein